MTKETMQALFLTAAVRLASQYSPVLKAVLNNIKLIKARNKKRLNYFLVMRT